MGRQFKSVDDDWELFPEGTTAVVLTSMHFVGKHEREWQGQRSTSDMVCLEWTAPEAGADGGDLSTWEVLTVAFGQKANLFKRLRALAGGREIPDNLDLSQMLGRPCLIEVIHRDSPKGPKPRVIGATPLPRGMVAPAWSGSLAYSDVDDPQAQPDPETAPAIVKWMLERRIVGTPAPAPAPTPRPAPTAQPPRGRAAPQAAPDFDDDIPF
ncbi:hypothetical protein [Thiocapsa sp. UBA6158]|jgi:hypothetical protein|uniref:hypothetical protein n=1 Tax=Thiocapsa sp. UBA6158 TaxID=1947692 RepID=UPI0025FEC44A|nr:hypothetical protein [Thiocapsa sp. UBA6158]